MHVQYLQKPTRLYRVVHLLLGHSRIAFVPIRPGNEWQKRRGLVALQDDVLQMSGMMTHHWVCQVATLQGRLSCDP